MSATTANEVLPAAQSSTNTFATVKAVCVPLVGGVTAERVEEWIHVFENMNPSSLPPLTGYALFPIIHGIRLALSRCSTLEQNAVKLEAERKQLELLYGAIACFFQRCPAFSIELAVWRNVWTMILRAPFFESKSQRIHVVINCMEAMLNCLPVQKDWICAILTNDSNTKPSPLNSLKAQVGYGIFQLVQVVSDISIDRSVIVNAFQALGAAVAALTLDTIPLGVIARFAPAIVSSCAKVAAGDYKLGAQIQGSALETMKVVIIALLRDESHEEYLKQIQPRSYDDLVSALGETEAVIQKSEETDDELAPLSCDKAWFMETRARIATFIDGVLHGMFRSGRPAIAPSLRIILIDFCVSVCDFCSQSLRNTTPTLLDHLLALCEDEVEHVSESANNAIEHLSKQGILDSAVSSDVVYEKLSQLPRLIVGQLTEASLHVSLASLKRYIEIAPGTKYLWDMHAEKILGWLLQVVTIDVSDVQILERAPTGSTFTFYQVRLLHVKSEQCRSDVVAVLNSLGGAAAEGVLVNRLLNFLAIAEKQIWLKEALFLVEELMQTGGSCVDLKIMIERIICIESLWSNSSMDTESLLSLMLAIRVIGKLSLRLQRETRQLLLQILFPLLLQIGHPSHAVEHTARVALASIASACEYESVTDLIVSNWDYLVDAIALRMKHDPATLRMLAALLESPRELEVSPLMVSLLDDVVDDVMIALDANLSNNSKIIDILRILKSYASLNSRLIPQKDEETEDVRSNDTVDVDYYSPDRILERLCNLREEFELQRKLDREWKIPEESSGNDSRPHEYAEEDSRVKADDDHDSHERQDDQESKIPPRLERFCCLVDRLRNLISARERPLQEQVLILQTIQFTFSVLQDHDNALLPAVAQSWNPLLALLRYLVENLAPRRGRNQDTMNGIEQAPLFVNALEVVRDMTQLCPDFIQRRFVNELWPVLDETFARSEQLHQVLFVQLGQPLPALTKLQMELFRCISKQGNASLEAVIIPLGSRVFTWLAHPHLEDTAKQLLDRLALINSDALYSALIRIQPPLATSQQHCIASISQLTGTEQHFEALFR